MGKIQRKLGTTHARTLGRCLHNERRDLVYPFQFNPPQPPPHLAILHPTTLSSYHPVILPSCHPIILLNLPPSHLSLSPQSNKGKGARGREETRQFTGHPNTGTTDVPPLLCEVGEFIGRYLPPQKLDFDRCGGSACMHPTTVQPTNRRLGKDGLCA